MKQLALITTLQEREDLCWYLPAWVLEYISERLDAPMIQIYSVASFHKMFHLAPHSKHHIRVYQGTTYHIGGDRAQ